MPSNWNVFHQLRKKINYEAIVIKEKTVLIILEIAATNAGLRAVGAHFFFFFLFLWKGTFLSAARTTTSAYLRILIRDPSTQTPPLVRLKVFFMIIFSVGFTAKLLGWNRKVDPQDTSPRFQPSSWNIQIENCILYIVKCKLHVKAPHLFFFLL